MHVGLVIYGSLDTVSGGYLYDRRLVGALREAGDQVEIISIPWRNYARHLTDNWSAGFLRRMRGRFDVLLQDELNHPSLAWANGRLRRGHPPIEAPLVAIVHHLRVSEVRPAWQNRFYGMVERRYLQSVDGFIANSRATQREVESMIGRPRPHIVAYPAGNRFQTDSPGTGVVRKRREGQPLRLLFVGNLIHRKGLHFLLAALALVSAEWHLRVVGSPLLAPSYVRRCRAQADRAGWGKRIGWCGALSDAALASEMSAADVLVVPSEYEGFGIVYLEGMGFGLPALATTGGGASEIITDGVNGFLVAPGDATALAGRIEALAADRSLLARMSRSALDYYVAHPTWAMTTSAIRNFLVDLTRRGN